MVRIIKSSVPCGTSSLSSFSGSVRATRMTPLGRQDDDPSWQATFRLSRGRRLNAPRWSRANEPYVPEDHDRESRNGNQRGSDRVGSSPAPIVVEVVGCA